MRSSKAKRVFSRREAEALIPELEKRLKSLRGKKEAYSRIHDSLFMHELVRAAERSNGFLEEKDDLEEGVHALEEAIEDLARDVEAIFALGVILRDVEKGQVEFRGSFEGKNVFFYWEVGESFLRHYRPLRSQYRQRLKLPGA